MFLSFWYKNLPKRYLVLFKRIAHYLADRLGISITLRNFFKPLYHDYTKTGRIVGILFRSFYLLTAAFVYICALCGLTFVFLYIFLFPPLFAFLLLANYANLQVWFIFISSSLALTAVYYLSLVTPSETIQQQAEGQTDYSSVLTLPARLLKKSADADYLLFSLLKKKRIKETISRLGVDADQFILFIQKELRFDLTDTVDDVYKEAYHVAKILGSNYVSVEHIFAVLFSKPQLMKAFSHFEIDSDYLKPVVLWQERIHSWLHPEKIWQPGYELRLGGGFNRSWVGVATPTLDRFGIDLTKKAQKGGLRRFLGNKNVLADLTTVLSRNQNNSAILIGPPGCGKTSLVYGVAHQIVDGGVADSIADKRLVKLDILGSKELREHLDQIVKEILLSENIILFIDEIHNLPPDAFAVLEPPLSDSHFQLVAACSLEDYRNFIENHGAFSRVLQVVEMPEADREITLRILEYLALKVEKENNLTITYPALSGAYALADRFVMDRVMPDKAVDLLDQAAALVAGKDGEIVTYDHVADVVQKNTHVPVETAKEEEADKLLYLEQHIHERLVDQEEAVKAVADAIRRVRSGLVNEQRPIASFLFVGPTGVGKTETAKALAECYYNDEETMIRFDMSEFQQAGSAERLLDSLTDAVRTRPFSLILLDEFEKADKDILNLFLQVMEDGRLTSTKGKTVNFTQTMLIATSNAGTDLIFEGLNNGKNIDELKDSVFDSLRKDFRPELLNRFDDVILYKPLSQTDMLKIAELKVAELQRKLESKKIKLVSSESSLLKLAEQGYDPSLGARPLRRLIQDNIEAELAKKLLSGELSEGESVSLEELL